ncbi:hypothetical protein BD310DRAFT_941587 [Dichomitus squalens]|uniref:Uncharacterized protein n=1 Tax=Dichomitus squalens TaxID=114155 RepID=A0A4Q9PGT4_9APHY|nr:hypothetical protein BD310DRAFT_941587 [Dichomitus squalens]
MGRSIPGGGARQPCFGFELPANIVSFVVVHALVWRCTEFQRLTRTEVGLTAITRSII